MATLHNPALHWSRCVRRSGVSGQLCSAWKHQDVVRRTLSESFESAKTTLHVRDSPRTHGAADGSWVTAAATTAQSSWRLGAACSRSPPHAATCARGPVMPGTSHRHRKGCTCADSQLSLPAPSSTAIQSEPQDIAITAASRDRAPHEGRVAPGIRGAVRRPCAGRRSPAPRIDFGRSHFALPMRSSQRRESSGRSEREN